jgi:hypothetical protein
MKYHDEVTVDTIEYLCDECRQDEVYAECGWCDDGRGYCGICLAVHNFAEHEEIR